MGQISLVVTSKVHQRDAPGTLDERQIAYRSASADLAPTLTKASADGRVTIRLGGFLELSVGDTGAIWRAHNPEKRHEFDRLFDLLHSRPDVEMRFLCELTI
jgi:hypothetical protein